MKEQPVFVMPEANVSHIRRKWLDIPYASQSPSQALDIYLPDGGDGPFPVIFHIHGGAFAFGDKRDAAVEPFLTALEQGYAVVSANYRLSGEAVFPAALKDLKTALRWLRARAGEFKLDRGRVAACGPSAGGYFVAMLCLTAGIEEFEGRELGYPNESSAVQAAVDWFGPTDFLTMDEQLAASGLASTFTFHSLPDSPESLFLGASVEEAPDLARKASPITYLRPDMPPLLVQHGRLDNVVPYQQSVELVEAIRNQVGPEQVEFDLFDEAGHMDPLFMTAENMARVFSFLNQRLGL
ncbi:MAG: alpha/beta hydrolase [Thermoleophilia bacterium]|nr:alpha/beta hydrolase [Thermoleophilia bacterium]